MKINICIIAAFLLFFGLCSFSYGQIAELKKFEFMKGEFKSRGSKDEILKADFDKSGKEFKWADKSTLNDDFGVITYDEPTKSYRLKEKRDSYIEPFYYKGIETNEGFHFYELTAIDGVIKENGDEVLIRPLEKGIFNIEHFYHYYGKEKPKEWIPSEYYSKNLNDKQLAKLTRLEIGKLDFLVGKFVSVDDKSEFIGKFTDDGKEFVWDFTSPEKTSEAVITYDFHWDEYTWQENIVRTNGEKTKIKYSGRIYENKKISVYARIDGKMTNITFSSPSKDKILMQLMIYDKTPQIEIFYTKVQ